MKLLRSFICHLCLFVVGKGSDFVCFTAVARLHAGKLILPFSCFLTFPDIFGVFGSGGYLTWVKTRYESPSGLIETNWKLEAAFRKPKKPTG